MTPKPIHPRDREIFEIQIRDYDPIVSLTGEITWQLPRHRVTVRSRPPCEPNLTATAERIRAARRPWYQPPAAEAAGDNEGGEA